MLRSLQYRDRCAGSRNGDGTASLRRMPHSLNVHTWRDKCAMFLLPHCQPGHGSESGCACKLRELPNAAHVPVRRKVCQMCGLQFCDISWGNTWCRPEVQQLKHMQDYNEGCFECTCIEFFFPEAISIPSLTLLELASPRIKREFLVIPSVLENSSNHLYNWIDHHRQKHT